VEARAAGGRAVGATEADEEEGGRAVGATEAADEKEVRAAAAVTRAAAVRVVEATLAMAVDLRAKVEAARAKVEAATVHPQQDLALTRAAAVPSKLRLCHKRGWGSLARSRHRHILHRHWAPGWRVGNARSQWSIRCKVGTLESLHPMRAMGSFQDLCGTYILVLTDAFAVVQA
jgi:hypothetical protein